jgi:predicted amidophosphoribosyltransferase
MLTRAPLFTGQERPLPDFGLHCAACEQPLAEAAGDLCSHCGERFDLSLAPGKNWLSVEPFVPRHLIETCCSILHGAGIPHMRGRDMLMLTKPTARRRIPTAHIVVHRDFYFDALYHLAEAARPTSQVASDPWICSSCDEQVPGGFEICWNCGQAHLGLNDICENEDGNG